MELVPSLSTVICCIITFFGSVLLANKNNKSVIEGLKTQKELEHEEYVKRSAFDIKKATIQDTLHFLDTFFSWLNFDSGIAADREAPKTNLTFLARDYYNKLCTTCYTSEIIDAFNAIVFSKGPIPLERYNDFRKAARNELELPEIKLDNEHIFISNVATNDLNKAK